MKTRTRSFSGICWVWMILAILIFSNDGMEAAASEKPQSGGTLIYAVGAEPPSFDGHRESTYAAVNPISPHYSLLRKFDQYKYPNIIGDLAESWTISQEHKTYTFKINKGVKFHDGSILTSKDIKATYDRIVFPAQGVISIRKAFYTVVEKIEAPDDHTVVFRLGPATIGDNVTINAGAVIDNSIIGNNVNVGLGAQVMLSVVGDGAFLPFRASLFMTTLMENSMVAQNTCLQMCVIGRNTFVGAGSTSTDYNLIPAPIRARDGHGTLSISNRPVIGGCVGHNCRIGSGMIVYPARTIESALASLP